MPYDKSRHTTILLEKERVAALRGKASALGLPFAEASNAGLVRAVLDLWLGQSAGVWTASGPGGAELAKRLDKFEARLARLEAAELDAAMIPAPAARNPEKIANGASSGPEAPPLAEENFPEKLADFSAEQKREARRLALWRTLWAEAGERIGSETLPMGKKTLREASGVKTGAGVKTALEDLRAGGIIEPAETIRDQGTRWRVLAEPPAYAGRGFAYLGAAASGRTIRRGLPSSGSPTATKPSPS